MTASLINVNLNYNYNVDFITYSSAINGFNQEVPGKCHTLSLKKVQYKYCYFNNSLIQS